MVSASRMSKNRCRHAC